MAVAMEFEDRVFLMSHFYSVLKFFVLPAGGSSSLEEDLGLSLISPFWFQLCPWALGLLWIGAFCSPCPVPAWQEGLDVESREVEDTLGISSAGWDLLE